MTTITDVVCNMKNLSATDGTNDLTGKIQFYPIGCELDALLDQEDTDTPRVAELLNAASRLCPDQLVDWLKVSLQS